MLCCIDRVDFYCKRLIIVASRRVCHWGDNICSDNTWMERLTWATSSKSSCLFCRARALWRDFPTPVCLLRKASPWFSIQSITWRRERERAQPSASQHSPNTRTGLKRSPAEPSVPGAAAFVLTVHAQISTTKWSQSSWIKNGTDETFMICVGNVGHCSWGEQDGEYSVPLDNWRATLMCIDVLGRRLPGTINCLFVYWIWYTVGATIMIIIRPY